MIWPLVNQTQFASIFFIRRRVEAQKTSLFFSPHHILYLKQNKTREKNKLLPLRGHLDVQNEAILWMESIDNEQLPIADIFFLLMCLCTDDKEL